jgi:hypothetical protein
MIKHCIQQHRSAKRRKVVQTYDSQTTIHTPVVEYTGPAGLNLSNREMERKMQAVTMIMSALLSVTTTTS